MDEWTNKMWIYRQGIIFSLKKEGLLIPATTWMNLENIMLSKSQSQKTTHRMIPFLQIPLL